jgi:hypothetical protein
MGKISSSVMGFENQRLQSMNESGTVLSIISSSDLTPKSDIPAIRNPRGPISGGKRSDVIVKKKFFFFKFLSYCSNF